MDEPSKQAWIRSAVAEYEQPLMRYAVRRTGCVETARDVVQDTFLKLWETDRDSVDGHLAAWLYTVCRNRAVDVCRKERRMKSLAFDPGKQAEATGSRESAAGSDADGDAGPRLPDAASEERHSALRQAIDQLNDKQQEAVRLKFQSGLSYREIAEVMDITVNHVGVLLHHALKLMRQKMTTSDDGQSTLPREQAR